MMNFKQLLLHINARPFIDQARFGIEREGQRVDLAGNLAKTDHPAIFGDRSYHPYIQTDFSETQTEMITPVTDSIPELFQYLAAVYDVTARSIPKEEMIWPLSMPPALPEKDEEIIIAKLKNFEDVLYRRYLAKEYGKRKQMVSGIHFNFEFGDELLRTLFSHQEEFQDFSEFKTELYLKTARNFMRYRWMITYLFGASPMSEKNYFLDESHPQEPVRSIRNSALGYTNHPNVKVSYASMKQYLADIERMIEEGKLSEEKEFYTPLRFRGGKKVADLATTGVRYIELRNIDLNPYARLGINPEQVRFLQLFLMYMLWTEEKEDSDQWVAEGTTRNNKVALEQPSDQTEFHQEGREILEGMKQMLVELDWLDSLYLVEEALTQMDHPEQTLAAKLYQEAQLSSQQEVAVALGHQYYKESHERPYQLAGFREMELSTQIFMFDAIQKGVQVKVLDESDQFLRLQFQDHVEYVKNANMTSKDSYIVPLIMENKTVTKKVLKEAGFRVPGGAEFSSMEEAVKAYPRFADQAFVIKPKSTNYGLGITIFKEGASLEDYQAGLAIAFREDSSVLVEEFMPGTEYRFFVIDGEVQAIMLRVPANVIGDGIRTVKELVEEKNSDPLRGTNHRAPLELIQLGELEQLMLKEQGLTIESVPQANQIVYLRENSNISTGGDSIDMTDEFSEAYKKIAVSAVEALGAKISGIDLIIPDKEIDPTTDKKAYGIIEANFNPAMHMHVYPFAGKGRRLTMNVLKLLYPEVF
ncbi:TPA: bifunctional glutamate--cysteine ligase GshA/glutathione synthetase GshB [Enterococcus faecium]|jgi:glutamate--cysteine ligase|uniref:bifunctional glutamate--cysteine ligase GshA/glutathione synthetase GshB n=1 Tax=Enterococcus TaxID=1350 RepID=UPI000E098C9D|nr:MULTISPECIES: bifunctional glutamate--cysteine ligase GshA/glutathione synthetase GshB [Enterococcus]EMF0400595.1 bifunctional glutamate--cysteine ligase GshA/glutathione synthetase GshB [Enterococcus faecium]MBE6166888.1 bifunctional glutamate--cysteine ligase GshA/glutathione synthetase GshB [Enterococcus faecium]MCB4530893.1 bifunctional glutamate--cysteine ligase GshA/glutathione synthetase GshB [Enterococcus faecium]MCR9045249.1 bifunctional glutamate--cysteine ligase GshA/glutathione s